MHLKKLRSPAAEDRIEVGDIVVCFLSDGASEVSTYLTFLILAFGLFSSIATVAVTTVQRCNTETKLAFRCHSRSGDIFSFAKVSKDDNCYLKFEGTFEIFIP